jgi:hypothetical protein
MSLSKISIPSNSRLSKNVGQPHAFMAGAWKEHSAEQERQKKPVELGLSSMFNDGLVLTFCG